MVRRDGCLGDSHGVLVVSTDDEEAVGNVFSRLQVGKECQSFQSATTGTGDERVSGEIC